VSGSRVWVVDYGAGNLRSVENALSFLGAKPVIARRPEELEGASRLLVPGVGEARAAMEALKASCLDGAIASFHRSGGPLLGICLGSQIIFEHSEERDTPCLALMPGTVVRFPVGRGVKVPHMGWNSVSIIRDHPLLAGIPEGAYFYFVHSYFPRPARSQDLLAESEHGCRFAAGVACGNLAAFQFHPEKSGPLGLRLLANFLAWEP